jgi:hypothetical protein
MQIWDRVRVKILDTKKIRKKIGSEIQYKIIIKQVNESCYVNIPQQQFIICSYLAQIKPRTKLSHTRLL